jgi:hypothetical protein
VHQNPDTQAEPKIVPFLIIRQSGKEIKEKENCKNCEKAMCERAMQAMRI